MGAIPAVMLVSLLALIGCFSAKSAPRRPEPPTVEVAAVVQKDVPIYREWLGNLEGFTNADIKPEVSGYLIQQADTEGTFVKRGKLLFQVDPRPFQAALDQVEAGWRRPKARWSTQTVEQSVATPIEQQMSGVDNMNYMFSSNATAKERKEKRP